MPKKIYWKHEYGILDLSVSLFVNQQPILLSFYFFLYSFAFRPMASHFKYLLHFNYFFVTFVFCICPSVSYLTLHLYLFKTVLLIQNDTQHCNASSIDRQMIAKGDNIKQVSVIGWFTFISSKDHISPWCILEIQYLCFQQSLGRHLYQNRTEKECCPRNEMFRSKDDDMTVLHLPQLKYQKMRPAYFLPTHLTCTP